MVQQVAFINREEQLSTVDKLVYGVDSKQILCIEADGGIGKTRLLQKIYQDYTEVEHAQTLLVVNIIDFDDQTFHISLNVEYQITQMLGENNFQHYLRALWDWRKLEAAGLSDERLSSERERTEQAFIECFNTVSVAKRVVILFDTIEAVIETDVWTFLLELGLYLDNVVLIFAGRNAGEFYKSLSIELKDMAEIINLEPLAPTATESYMQAKQDLLHIDKPSDLLARITWLSKGKPILIDLAIEWLARNVPLEWISAYTLEELESLPPLEKQKRQREFEQQLVQPVARTQRLIDRLNLIMSCVYPLDVKLISTLLGKPHSEAQALFEEAQVYAFVKSLPDGRISLHDEVRRMIHDYVWVQVDPRGDRRRWYSEQFTQHLNDEITALKNQVVPISIEKEKSTTLNIFMKREVLERKIWVLEEQRLRHTLYSNLEQGIKVFTKLFDMATVTYRSHIRNALLVEVGKYQDDLSPEQLYELAIRNARYLFDSNEYAKAKEVLETLNYDTLLPLRKIELLQLMGNIEIRLDNLTEGINRFIQAKDVVANMDDTPARTAKQAQVQNALGWSYRLLGKIETAIEEYQAAFEYATQLENMEELIASILNNLGYAYYLRGDKSNGLSYCLQALGIVPPSDTQQIGFINSTLGEIYLGLGNYGEASRHYEVALACFKDISNNEGQVIVQAEISHSKRHLASMEAKPSVERKTLLTSALENAQASVEICQRYNLLKDMPLCYYEIGRVLIDLEKFDKASAYLEASYPQNLRRAGGFALADLTALAEIAYYQQDYVQVEHWVNETRVPEKKKILFGSQRTDTELFYGRLLRFLAESQLEQAQYDQALLTYQEALIRISHHGGYGAYRLDHELDRLKEHIAELPPDVKNSWCDRFIQVWQSGTDSDKYRRSVLAAVRLARLKS